MSVYGRPDVVGRSVRLLLLTLVACEQGPRLSVRLGARPAASRSAHFVVGVPEREDVNAAFDLRQIERPEVIIHGGAEPPSSISLDVVLRDEGSASVAEGAFVLPFPGCVLLSFEGEARATTCDGAPLRAPDAGEPMPDAGAIDAKIEEDAGASDAQEEDASIDASIDGAIDTGVDAGALFPYEPSHVDPSLYGYSDLIVSSECTIDSTTRMFLGCSGTMEIATQADGSELAVVPVNRFEVRDLVTLTLRGSRPFVFLVVEDAMITGDIDASATDESAGPGSTPERCVGRDGIDATPTANKVPGGSGAGHRHAGGRGGASEEVLGPEGGAAAEVLDLSRVLLPGCSGGSGATQVAPPSAGGFGGGAVQISAAGTITVGGGIFTNGAGGAGGPLSSGGAGGGSGGAVLLEATTIDLAGSAVVVANGGGGGEGGGSDAAGAPGEDGKNGTAVAEGGETIGGFGGSGGDGGAEDPSGNGLLGGEGGGGGGGSSGQISLRGSCRIDPSAQLSPLGSCVDL